MTEATMLQPSSVLTAVDQFFADIFGMLTEWAPELSAALAVSRTAPLTGAQLSSIVEPGAHRVLNDSELPLYGAGFCAAEGLVSEGNPLAWWQGPERSLLASSTFGPGQAAIDLHRLEWFRVPAATGAGHVAGPFVDYLCSNEITLTAALPVLVGGTFAGVVCADVLVSALENVLLNHLASLGTASLSNTSGRVVLSTDASLQTGDRLPEGLRESADGVVVHASTRYPFVVVIHPPVSDPR